MTTSPIFSHYLQLLFCSDSTEPTQVIFKLFGRRWIQLPSLWSSNRSGGRCRPSELYPADDTWTETRERAAEKEEGERGRQTGEEVCTFQDNPDRTYPSGSSQDTTTYHVDVAGTHTHAHIYTHLRGFGSADYLWAGGLALFVKGLCERMLVLRRVCERELYMCVG